MTPWAHRWATLHIDTLVVPVSLGARHCQGRRASKGDKKAQETATEGKQREGLATEIHNEWITLAMNTRRGLDDIKYDEDDFR
jgi:hypothetical protein